MPHKMPLPRKNPAHTCMHARTHTYTQVLTLSGARLQAHHHTPMNVLLRRHGLQAKWRHLLYLLHIIGRG